MTVGTLAVSAVLVAIVALIIRDMIKQKKAGKSLQCDGNCTKCKGGCH